MMQSGIEPLLQELTNFTDEGTAGRPSAPLRGPPEVIDWEVEGRRIVTLSAIEVEGQRVFESNFPRLSDPPRPKSDGGSDGVMNGFATLLVRDLKLWHTLQLITGR
jgi:hypothetical protein